ncbi:hypothetical protein A2V54_01970 [candidate division WWE3 bacterium RBG_19FT_COMBO_53_11]|uniref:Uncharacterized protein n=1 Tax=candidate division WWE3 bacterium RBG_19FT_COMBO_53_11 TaxID=1802613 RepID=A0A1F4UI95_UNCKA|nr:MAG: hypothetical protein A2155_01180 [candidate division WWE3 bacterium RBG_16_52_45]OGC44520.1 MAG: hypothetical protein A2V54_01970 [candidate division WWE3 bacterium RBG_19FT_COMBO_53_11]
MILAPLETMGILRKGFDQFKTITASAETQSLVSKFKIELPKLSSSISDILAKFLPWLEVKVKEVK